MSANQLRSKLDRAVWWYIKNANIYSHGVVASVTANIYPANWSGQIDLSKGTVGMVRSHEGSPTLTGGMGNIRTFYVEIQADGSVANQPHQANPGAQRVALDLLAGMVNDALSLSFDDGQSFQATADAITAAGRALATTGGEQDQANNADMLAFTCQYWYLGNQTGGHPQDEGGGKDSTRWIEISGFTAVCCASNVS
jgi:hypothetical protein